MPLYEKVMARLHESGKFAWFEQECQNHSARKTQGSDPRQAYLEIINAWQLGRRELAILRELAAWRQQEAVRRDLALNFVVKELHLFKVAERRPTSLRDLNELGLAPIEIKIHGKRMLDIVASAQQSDPEGWPEPIRRLVDYPSTRPSSSASRPWWKRRPRPATSHLSWWPARRSSTSTSPGAGG